jgi:LPS export ABC transporter protein LptC
MLLLGLPVLVGCEAETSAPIVSDDLLELQADDLILGMEHQMTQSGVRYADLYADTAFYFRDSTKYELRQLRLKVYTVNGNERATLTSDWGELEEGSEAMVARRNVVLILPESDGRLETTELHYDPVAEKFWSDSATVFTEAGNVIRGTGFDSDLAFQNVVVRGARTTGGGVIRF